MEERNEEREWVRRITTGRLSTKNNEQKNDPPRATEADPPSAPAPRKEKLCFKDVAGMDELKRLVTEGFINVLHNQECANAFHITPPSLLLYGPAGCGKTFFAEVLANEVGVNIIKVLPDDIASKWVHGTQEKIGEIFRKAERESPTILFFDEFDAMVPKRTEGDKASQNGEVNEFLCMLNNASQRGIYVIAATNHPEVIDKAVLRTGRIDEMIYVDMPDKATRESLFRISLAQLPTDKNIDYGRLADLTDGYNCSDISYIVKVASRRMFNASISDKGQPYKLITQCELEKVIAHKSPSLTSRDLSEYERVHREFAPKGETAERLTIGFM